MTPCHVLLGLQARRRKPRISITAMSTQGRPMTDARNDVALEYLSTHTLAFMMISLLILLMFVTLPGRPNH